MQLPLVVSHLKHWFFHQIKRKNSTNELDEVERINTRYGFSQEYIESKHIHSHTLSLTHSMNYKIPAGRDENDDI